MFTSRVRAAPHRDDEGRSATNVNDAVTTTRTTAAAARAATAAAARGDAADIMIAGKRYPTHLYGRALSRYPHFIALAVLVQLVLACIGIIGYVYFPSYALADFALTDAVDVHAAAAQQAAFLDAWTAELSGEAALLRRVDTSRSRTRVVDRIEVRYALRKVDAELRYRYGPDADTPTGMLHDLMHVDNQRFLYAIESALVNDSSYRDVCFTNNLAGGHVNPTWPTCVPPVSVLQYTFARYNATSSQWIMDGSGSIYQQNVVPRMLVNPNYGWFVDANFSPLTRTARQLRTHVVLATSPESSRTDYARNAERYVARALRFLAESVSHPAIDVYMGGDAVERVRVTTQLSREMYKVAVVFALCAVFAFVYCRSVFIAVYAAAQVLVTYFVACGVYLLIFHVVPIVAYAAVLWVTTFTLHGSLAFYGVFVQSGSMTTHGRGNDLGVAQRVCLTLRRVSVAVCIADVLAMLVFAVNTSSAFASVYAFSVFMIIACASNMYAIAIVTPAFVVLHHRVFSGRRRNLQKQTDVRKAARLQCRRPGAMQRVLAAVQSNMARGDVMYVHDDDVLRARIGAGSGVNKRRYGGVRPWVAAQLATLHEAMLTARHGVVGAAHKFDKTTTNLASHLSMELDSKGEQQQQQQGQQEEQQQQRVVAPEAFVLEEFAELPRGNPLGKDKHGGDGVAQDGAGEGATATATAATTAGVVAAAPPRYFNRRLVREADVVHVPVLYTTRSVDCWATMTSALNAATTTTATGAARDGNDKGNDIVDGDMDDNDERSVRTPLVNGPPVVAPLSRDLLCTPHRRSRRHHNGNDDDDGEDEDAAAMALLRRGNAAASSSTLTARVQALGQHWSSVGRRLGLDVGEGLESRPLFALRARAVVRAQDPNWVICVREGEDDKDDSEDDSEDEDEHNNNSNDVATGRRRRRARRRQRNTSNATATTTRMTARDIETSGLSLRKLRQRLVQRRVRRRRRCWGLCGPLVDETPAMRMRRLLSRRVRREGYSVVDRVLMHYYVPATMWARWGLLALLALLVVLVCVFGARVSPAAPPVTLRSDAAGRTAAMAFARLDGTYGQRGTCTFCGPYYRDVNEYHVATAADVQTCGRSGDMTLHEQMNVYVDACGVCDGANACIDCAGVPYGQSVTSVCGGCTLRNETLCRCVDTRECPYCLWVNSVAAAAATTTGVAAAADGKSTCTQPMPLPCEVATSPMCSGHGKCNWYSGDCICGGDYAGSQCARVAPWAAISHALLQPLQPLQPQQQQQEAAQQPAHDTAHASASDDSDVVCLHGGTLPYGATSCACVGDWTGRRCDASRRCGGRGVWLAANESPTGVAMCACKGHWRGATCQLCDCRNGGMCDDETGQCSCVGDYVGPRCQLCSASCVLHGSCPAPTSPTRWNVRACIAEVCSASDVEQEVVCAECAGALALASSTASQAASLADSTACGVRERDKTTCMLRPDCWWVDPPTTAATSNSVARAMMAATMSQSSSSSSSNDDNNNKNVQSSSVAVTASGCMTAQAAGPLPTRDVACTCRKPLVWSGVHCDVCLAPRGGVCTFDDKVRACNGLEYDSPQYAVAEDNCGVCGGDGLCRGCDGVPMSGKVVDACGVCGGNCTSPDDNNNNTASSSTSVTAPLYVDYMIDLRGSPRLVQLLTFARPIMTFCRIARQSRASLAPRRCLIEDYVDHQRTQGGALTPSSHDSGDNGPYLLIDDLYEYARVNARLSEIGFLVDDSDTTRDDNAAAASRRHGPLLGVAFMSYRLRLDEASAPTPRDVYDLHAWLREHVLDATRDVLARINATATVTSSAFEPAVAQVLSTVSLWFVVVIGVVLSFALLLIYFVSATAALLATAMVVAVCFGVLTVCSFRDAWRLDAVLQPCVTCTLPIALEYAVHLLSGYYDYLQTSTSHLFARTVTRRAAVQGTVLRVLPPLYTTVVAVVLSAVAFATSALLPLRRSGQVCIMLHLVLLVVVTLFVGALAAIGPLTIYKHWLLSLVLAALCFIAAAVTLAIIYGTGGILGPNGHIVLSA